VFASEVNPAYPYCWIPFGVHFDGAPECPRVGPDSLTLTPMLSLNLPAGDYVVSATFDLVDQAQYFLENNSRKVYCDLTTALEFDNVYAYLANRIGRGSAKIYLDGFGGNLDHGTISFHATTHLAQPQTVYASCWASNQDDANHIQTWATAGTLTAIKADTITRQ